MCANCDGPSVYCHAVDGCINYRFQGESCEVKVHPDHQYLCGHGLTCATPPDQMVGKCIWNHIELIL